MRFALFRVDAPAGIDLASGIALQAFNRSRRFPSGNQPSPQRQRHGMRHSLGLEFVTRIVETKGDRARFDVEDLAGLIHGAPSRGPSETFRFALAEG